MGSLHESKPQQLLRSELASSGSGWDPKQTPNPIFSVPLSPVMGSQIKDLLDLHLHFAARFGHTSHPVQKGGGDTPAPIREAPWWHREKSGKNPSPRNAEARLSRLGLPL